MATTTRPRRRADAERMTLYGRFRTRPALIEWLINAAYYLFKGAAVEHRAGRIGTETVASVVISRVRPLLAAG